MNGKDHNIDDMERLLSNCKRLPQWVKEEIHNGYNGHWSIGAGGERYNGYLALNGDSHKVKIHDDMIPELIYCLDLLGDNVTELNLDDDFITSKGAILLFDSLKRRGAATEFIYLNNNNLDDDCIQSIGEFLKSNQSVSDLDIGCNKITDNGIEILSSYLEGNKTLEHLYIQENKGITDKSMPILVKVIESSRIEDIDINSTSISKKNILISSLAQNVIKYGGTSLNLKEKGLNDEDINEICEAMRKYNLNKLKEINLANNEITSKGVASLLSILNECQTNITKIDLSENLFDDDCMTQLGRYLSNNAYLQKLDIGYNNITDEGIEILDDVLNGNLQLKELNLEGNNHLTDDAIPYLIKIAKKMNLSKINLKTTMISNEKQDEIANYIARISKLMCCVSSKKITNLCLKKEFMNMFKVQVVPAINHFMDFKDSMINDVDLFEIFIKIDRFDSMLKSIEKSEANAMFDEFKSRLEEIMSRFKQVDILDEDLIKKSMNMDGDECKQKGIERDKERSKVIEDFNKLKTFIDPWNIIIESNESATEWEDIAKLGEEIKRAKSKIKTFKLDTNGSYAKQLQLKPNQIVKDLMLCDDWMLDGNEMIHHTMTMMHEIKRATELTCKSIVDFNKHLAKKIDAIEDRYEELIQIKQKKEKEFEALKKKIKQEMDQHQEIIKKHIMRQNKRKKINKLKKEIEKKDENTTLISIAIRETQLDLERRRKSLSQFEKAKLEKQIKDSENKLRILKIEHEDLIDELNKRCNDDEDGKCIFPDLLISTAGEQKNEFTSQNENGIYNAANTNNHCYSYSSTSESNGLIKIPLALKMKTNRCEIMEKIGDGAFSSVYRVKIKKRGRDQDDDIFAFKQFNISRSTVNINEIKMIEKEIEMLEHLEHDNIVKIVGVNGDPNARDVNEERMGIGIIMQYCENGSLRSLLNKSGNQLNLNLIIHLLFGAAQGLEYLHGHEPCAIIHGDIKSDNILVDSVFNAKLCDFGISKLMQSSIASTKGGGNIGGTLAYRAPESFGAKVELKSDVYSFGCVILEMLTGERPWNELGNDITAIIMKIRIDKVDHDLSKIRKDAASDLVDLMKRCLNYDKDKRPSMREVRMELEKLTENALLINLDERMEEYKKVESLFFPEEEHRQGSLNRNNYRIVKIEKVICRFADMLYDAELEKIRSTMFKISRSLSASSSSTGTSSSLFSSNFVNEMINAKERLLFHGTRYTDPLTILNHPNSFMKDFANEGFYGKGLYFAEFARYCNGYYDEDDNGRRQYYRYNVPNTNQHQILLCSVICGRSKEFKSEIKQHFTQKDLGIDYHSVHGGPHQPSRIGAGEDDSKVYVVYKDTQVTAKYLITYESLRPTS